MWLSNYWRAPSTAFIEWIWGLSEYARYPCCQYNANLLCKPLTEVFSCSCTIYGNGRSRSQAQCYPCAVLFTITKHRSGPLQVRRWALSLFMTLTTYLRIDWLLYLPSGRDSAILSFLEKVGQSHKCDFLAEVSHRSQFSWCWGCQLVFKVHCPKLLATRSLNIPIYLIW